MTALTDVSFPLAFVVPVVKCARGREVHFPPALFTTAADRPDRDDSQRDRSRSRERRHRDDDRKVRVSRPTYSAILVDCSAPPTIFLPLSLAITSSSTPTSHTLILPLSLARPPRPGPGPGSRPTLLVSPTTCHPTSPPWPRPLWSTSRCRREERWRTYQCPSGRGRSTCQNQQEGE